MKAREIPALEAKHREAAAKAASQVARLKHALKEAEAAAAAAQAAAASTAGQATLQGQLQEAVRERERCVRVACVCSCSSCCCGYGQWAVGQQTAAAKCCSRPRVTKCVAHSGCVVCRSAGTCCDRQAWSCRGVHRTYNSQQTDSNTHAHTPTVTAAKQSRLQHHHHLHMPPLTGYHSSQHHAAHTSELGHHLWHAGSGWKLSGWTQSWPASAPSYASLKRPPQQHVQQRGSRTSRQACWSVICGHCGSSARRRWRR